MTAAVELGARFAYYEQTLTYCTDGYNNAAENERAVEVPIAAAFLDTVTGVGVEVGNVLAHYLPDVSHRVVDRYEAGAESLDVFDLTGPLDWVLSVSTLEHVRWDDPEPVIDPTGAPAALHHLVGLLADGGRLLVTVPFGHHPHLDATIFAGEFRPARECSMVRDADIGWRQAPVTWRPYGETGRWAESVWVAEFRR